MPESLKPEEVSSKTDPSVAKQYDTSAPKSEQWNDLYALADKAKAGLLTTIRSGIGPVSRSMTVAKRAGPDFLFLANAHSKKFADLDINREVQITFQNSSTQDWASITGTATTADNSDPRISELYSPAVRAWFGDLGDGVHNGKAKDPRMALIEVKARYITYWKSTTSTGLGFVKEVAGAVVKGDVAVTGVLRELDLGDIEIERSSE